MHPDTAVLVLGGTGHIGAAIARAFADTGREVRASGRSVQPRPNLHGTDINQLAGDDTNTANLQAWSDNIGLIIDAATPYPVLRYGVRPRAVVEAARTRMRAVLDLATRRNAALIHISSFTTLPASGSLQDRLRLATVRGMHPYFEVKEVVEREVLGTLNAGLKGCVINPSACFGPYDMKPAEQAFVPMLMQGKVAGTVGHPINVVDVRDVAASVVACADQGFVHRRVPVFGHNIRIDALTRQVCALGGVAAPALRAPLLMALAGTYWAETAAAAMGRDTPWPSLPVLLTAAGRNMERSVAQTALGVPIRPLSETLTDAITWYRQIGRC